MLKKAPLPPVPINIDRNIISRKIKSKVKSKATTHIC